MYFCSIKLRRHPVTNKILQNTNYSSNPSAKGLLVNLCSLVLGYNSSSRPSHGEYILVHCISGLDLDVWDGRYVLSLFSTHVYLASEGWFLECAGSDLEALGNQLHFLVGLVVPSGRCQF